MTNLLKLYGVGPKLLVHHLRFGIVTSALLPFFFKKGVWTHYSHVGALCRFSPMPFLFIIVLHLVSILKSMMTMCPSRLKFFNNVTFAKHSLDIRYSCGVYHLNLVYIVSCRIILYYMTTTLKSELMILLIMPHSR